jgi:hypothetical protein
LTAAPIVRSAQLSGASDVLAIDGYLKSVTSAADVCGLRRRGHVFVASRERVVVTGKG